MSDVFEEQCPCDQSRMSERGSGVGVAEGREGSAQMVWGPVDPGAL